MRSNVSDGFGHKWRRHLMTRWRWRLIEELRGSPRSTRMHYTTIDTPCGVKLLEDIIEDLTSVLATVLTSLISVRATAVNLADVPTCVACVLFQ